jgi:hypothetical protein
VRPSELDDSVLNEMLVGVATSVEEETDDGNTGTDVNGWSGDCGGPEVRGDGDPGIVLIRSTDDSADPLGRKKDVLNDTSTSCSAIDWTEGEGWSGKEDAVETDETTSEDGVITEVEPRDESSKVGSKLG